jgi:hypothetical protein
VAATRIFSRMAKGYRATWNWIGRRAVEICEVYIEFEIKDVR